MVRNNLGVDNEKTEYQRIVVPDDAYSAEITDISEVFLSKRYKSEEKDEKIVISFHLDSGETLPYFVWNNLTHGKKGDSSLLKLLTQLGCANEITSNSDKFGKMPNEEWVKWLRSKALKQKFRVITKTTTPETGAPYSTIKEVVKRL